MAKPCAGPAAAATSARNIEAKAKSIEALELRKKGKSYRQIAAEVGYANAGGAYKAVRRELDLIAKQCSEEARQVRDLELQRLDDLYVTANEAVEGGSETAIDRCLRIMERRAKLLGLDAAEKIEHSGDIVINLRTVDMGVPDE